MRSLAIEGETSSRSKITPPAPGKIPSEVSGRQRREEGEEMRRSQARASSRPQPMAGPERAAMVGRGWGRGGGGGGEGENGGGGEGWRDNLSRCISKSKERRATVENKLNKERRTLNPPPNPPSFFFFFFFIPAGAPP